MCIGGSWGWGSIFASAPTAPVNNAPGMPTAGGSGVGGEWGCSPVFRLNVVHLPGGSAVGSEEDTHVPSALNPDRCSHPFSFLAPSLWAEEPGWICGL